MLMHGLLLILERQAHDQLPGGKYSNPSESVKNISSTVPSTNMASEQDFAVLDLLVRSKPHATKLAYEALIMWQHNGTLAWLQGKSEEKKHKLMENARKGAGEAQARYKERRKILQERKLEKLKKKQSDKEESAQKAQHQKVKALSNLTKLGLSVWTTVEEVDNKIAEMEENDQKDAVLAQLNVQKFVLLSKGQRHLFQQTQTVNGEKIIFDLPTLVSHLKQIIVQNPGLSEPQQSSKHGITTREDLRPKVLGQKKLLKQKVQDWRDKLVIKQQKDLLPNLLKQPQSLVGRRVRHKVVEEDSDEVFGVKAQCLT